MTRIKSSSHNVLLVKERGKNDNQGSPPSPYRLSKALSIAAFNVLSQ